MSKAKKKPPEVRLDTVVLCTRCPGNLRIKPTAYHGELYLPNFTCGVCKQGFSVDATAMVADTPETNGALKEREPKIVEYKLAAAEKTIEARDRDITLLRERVESYERAMQWMGGGAGGVRLMRMPY